MAIASGSEQGKVAVSAIINCILRTALGILLVQKGISFIHSSGHLEEVIMKSRFASSVKLLIAYISFAHLFGGTFIVMGLFTRIAVILQIPILIGAFIFNLGPDAFGTGTDLVLSIVALILLIYFLIKGGGEISMDDYLKRNHL